MDPIGLRPTDAIALVDGAGNRMTYRELLRKVTSFARELPVSHRCLVALLGDRELGTLSAYLAAMRTGHAAAWFGAARGPERQLALIRAFEPELLVGPQDVVQAAVTAGRYRAVVVPGVTDVMVAGRLGMVAEEIHPDTRLLLLTSGSVSGGRAVRLSARSVAANSAAICTTLEIDESLRGATSLPLYYAYGLSVLHSHLRVGGSLLLTTMPATGQRFWRSFAKAGCGIFSGVPMHFEWLDRARMPWRRTAGLAKLTVAGGRMRPALSDRFHQSCQRTGQQFYKMYGQTEATARISILRPENFAGHAASVGRPLPGSHVTIKVPQPGETDPSTVGEVVYAGPSAMQGYASSRADLALPDQNRGVVHTGDLGYLRDGFLYLTGRISRFIKPEGRRIALDEIEDVFADFASAAAVGTDQEQAHVFVESARRPAIETARTETLARLGLSPAMIQLHYVSRLPRTPSGKIDYRRLAAEAVESVSPR